MIKIVVILCAIAMYFIVFVAAIVAAELQDRKDRMIAHKNCTKIVNQYPMAS